MTKQKYIFRAIYFTSIVVFLSACIPLYVGVLNKIELTKISVQGDNMYLLGDFNSLSYQQVKIALEENPHVKTFVLTASSGSLDDETTFKLARYLRAQGLNSHLLHNSVVASGAVDLFLSGVSRTIEKGARLGVHSWSDGSKEGKDFPKNHPDHKLNANYIRDMLGKDDFYWFTIYSAPADSIYWMKEAEILKYQMITAPLLEPSVSQTPFGQDFLNERELILND